MRFLGPRFFTRLITTWIALSVAGIALGVFFWKHLNGNFEATLDDARFHHEVDVLYRLVEDEEANQRGYLLTGDNDFLVQLKTAEAEFDRRFDALSKMSFDNDALRKDVIELGGMAELKRAFVKRTLATRDALGLSAAIAVVETKEGMDEMIRIRAILSKLNHERRDRFLSARDSMRDDIQRTLFVTTGSSLVGLAAGVLAFYLSRVALRQEREARHHAEQALATSRAMKEKSAFLANMSHEIRTPMNAILGFSDLLAAGLPPGGRQRGYTQAIRESATSLLQLINDVLDLSKIEAGKVELHPEPTAPSEITGFLQTVFAQQAVTKGLRLEFVLDRSLPQAVLLDPTRMRQVLVNLLGNAIKYTEKGKICVRMSWELNTEKRDRGTLAIDVTDTGAGIAPDRQKQIFEAFSQDGGIRASESPDAGLGLNIVKRLVQRMGGTVALESALDQGSTFRVRLPDVGLSFRLPQGTQPETFENVDFDVLVPSNILVVDDNAANRDLLEGYFHGTHHRLTYASDGLEAIESVRAHTPDLVLMDIRMPKMDGRRALEEIRKLPGSEMIPIVAVTASTMTDDEFVLRSVFAGFIRKPFTRHSLFRELSGFIPRNPTPFGVSGPSVRRTESAASDGLVAPERRAELVASLRELEAKVWPAVRENGAINETKGFARKLADLGSSFSCVPLVNYAQLLQQDAETYAVARLASDLNDYPVLVGSLASAREPSPT
jgi:signal transduction histidine kinase/CheY-like chemotaxis protein